MANEQADLLAKKAVAEHRIPQQTLVQYQRRAAYTKRVAMTVATCGLLAGQQPDSVVSKAAVKVGRAHRIDRPNSSRKRRTREGPDHGGRGRRHGGWTRNDRARKVYISPAKLAGLIKFSWNFQRVPSAFQKPHLHLGMCAMCRRSAVVLAVRTLSHHDSSSAPSPPTRDTLTTVSGEPK